MHSYEATSPLHYSDVAWGSWSLKSQATRLFIQQPFSNLINTKKTPGLDISVPLWRKLERTSNEESVSCHGIIRSVVRKCISGVSSSWMLVVPGQVVWSTFASWWGLWLPQNYVFTHEGRDKMTAIFHTTFSNAFSSMKMYEFRLTVH